MEEVFEILENRIKEAGVPLEISGVEFYTDISREADEKENGDYMFLIKKEENVIYEGCMTVYEDDFDLHYVDITVDEQRYHVDFDI